MVQVKICGVNSPEAADAVAAAGADYAGLVFYPPSPRHVGYEQATALAARLRGRCRVVGVVGVGVVGVVVDASDAELDAVVSAVRPDVLQLHGRETAGRVATVRQRFGLPVMKAISIADASDLSSVAAYEQVADMLLFDAKAPKTAARPGGHGAAFDWQLLRGRRFSRPWLVGGGLHADNVGRAIRACDAPGVDCSSGVETETGAKSAHLIREFVAAVRAAAFAGAEV